MHNEPVEEDVGLLWQTRDGRDSSTREEEEEEEKLQSKR
jgi:hypothetical protein